jgi:hypothetical protein
MAGKRLIVRLRRRIGAWLTILWDISTEPESARQTEIVLDRDSGLA